MKTNHTPTPWRVGIGAMEDETAIYCGDVHLSTQERKPENHRLIADCLWKDPPSEERKANAAFIVEAVNSHAALLAQNKALRDALVVAQCMLAPCYDEDDTIGSIKVEIPHSDGFQRQYFVRALPEAMKTINAALALPEVK